MCAEAGDEGDIGAGWTANGQDRDVWADLTVGDQPVTDQVWRRGAVGGDLDGLEIGLSGLCGVDEGLHERVHDGGVEIAGEEAADESGSEAART